jgi:hypothetical protein
MAAAAAAAAARAWIGKFTGTIVVRCYLSNGNEAEHYNIVSALNDCAKGIEFRLSIVGDPEVGSIYQDVVLMAVRALRNHEVLIRIRKVFQAIAGTDSLATVRGLQELLKSSDNAVIQMNELLLVKTTASDGTTNIAIRKLSEAQSEWISTNKSVLLSPQKLLEELGATGGTRNANTRAERRAGKRGLSMG